MVAGFRLCLGRSRRVVRELTLTIAIAGVSGLLIAAPPNGAMPPNIVVIMADDLSLDAFNVLLDGGWLPNIETNLEHAGVRFENAFVTNALCCPSRATFLTGQYTHNHRVFSNTPGIGWSGWFPEDQTPGRNESTIATWLQGAGYYTGYVGKYLNGYGTDAPEGFSDPRLYIPPGWDDWKGLIDPTTYRVYDYSANENGAVVDYGSEASDYQTDVLAGHAASFIDQVAGTGQPFLLTVMPLAPHVEVFPNGVPENPGPPTLRDIYSLTIRPAPRHTHLVDGDTANGEMPELVQKPSFNEPNMSDKPSCPFELPVVGTVPLCVAELPTIREVEDLPKLQLAYKTMLASMLAVDDLVGTVVDALNDAGVLEDTVLVFTSDNGWFYGEHRAVGKELPYEEAIRVPLLIRSPGHASGAVASQVVLNNDLAPTLASLGGAVVPYEPDGVDFTSVLADPFGAPWGRVVFLIEHWFGPSPLLWQHATNMALRFETSALDLLYAITFADLANPSQITDEEFYFLNIDPYQRTSLNLPPFLQVTFFRYLAAMLGCSGQSCHELEGFE